MADAIDDLIPKGQSGQGDAVDALIPPNPNPQQQPPPQQQQPTTPEPAPTAGGDAVDALIPARQKAPAPSNTGEGEAWYNRPITTYFGLPESREGAGPVERAGEKFISGLTTPVSLGLLLVTGGLGSLAEGAGASALEGLAPEVAGQVSKAAGVIAKLANVGFTGQQIYGVAKAVPRIADAIKAGDANTAIEMSTSVLLNGAVAGLGARHLAKGLGWTGEEPLWTQDKDVIAASQQPQRQAGAQALKFRSDWKDIYDDKPLDIATRFFHEAGGDVTTLQRWQREISEDTAIRPQLRQKYEAILGQAQNLPERAKALSAQLRTDYAKDWDRIQELGKASDEDSSGAPNYSGQHTYNLEDEGSSSLRNFNRITKSPQFLKERTFKTIEAALHEGFEPKDLGLAGARYNYIQHMGMLEGAMSAENELLNGTADDMRPTGVNPASVITKDGKQLVRIKPSQDITEAVLDREKSRVQEQLSNLNQGLPPGGGKSRLVVDDGKLYWDVSDYKEGPDVFKRSRYITEDKYGDPVYQKKNVLIHPDIADDVNQAFNDSSWFRKNPVLRIALGASTQAKKSLLSFSPFHWTTEYLRGIQMGLSPWEALNPPEITPDSLAAQTKFGPKLAAENFRDATNEGLAQHTALVNKIPLAGKALTAVEDKLFGAGGYIDRLKAATFEKVTRQLSDRNPNWSQDQAQFAASKIVDAAYGGLNWKMLGASMNSVDALRLLTLAPDFTGSQLLFGKYGFGPGGSVVAQSLGRIALYNFAVARILNMVTSGKLHMEHPFGVSSPDGKNVFSVRTMPEDIAHALTDPRGFAYNRLNPLITRTGYEFISGRDEQGKRADYEKQLHDLLRNVLPIPSQNFVPSFKREGESTATGFARAAGLAVQPDRSSADALAGLLASDRSESGPVDRDKLAHHQAMIQFEDAMRAGKATPQDLHQAYDRGIISLQDAKQITKNVQETRDMDPATARLYTRVTRLPMKDFLEVWDIATPPEKLALEKLFAKKRADYMRSAAKNMSLAERNRDPVYTKLRAMHPNEPPW